MYSKHQIECLDELGIQGFEPKPEFQSQTVSVEHTPEHSQIPDIENDPSNDLAWQTVAPSLLKDLKVLLPELELKETFATFVVNQQTMKWRQSSDISSPSFEQNCLSTGALVNLTVAEKREIWHLLQSVLGESN
ncbi:MAG: hypothetical protein HWE26_12430 [Alteromonadaceae bacterium]|nr:hypothetical protein [Alteromonadaceae bacterium]